MFYFFKVAESSWKVSGEGTPRVPDVCSEAFLILGDGLPFRKLKTCGQVHSHLPSSYTPYTWTLNITSAHNFTRNQQTQEDSGLRYLWLVYLSVASHTLGLVLQLPQWPDSSRSKCCVPHGWDKATEWSERAWPAGSTRGLLRSLPSWIFLCSSHAGSMDLTASLRRGDGGKTNIQRQRLMFKPQLMAVFFKYKIELLMLEISTSFCWAWDQLNHWLLQKIFLGIIFFLENGDNGRI